MNKIKWACFVFAIALLTIVVITQMKQQRSAQDEWQSVNAEMADTLQKIQHSDGTNHPSSVAPTEQSSPQTPSDIKAEADTGGPININTATLEQLDVLPGIGPSKAQAIIDYRTKFGLFRTLEQLMEVKGIGLKTFENIKGMISIATES